MDKFVAEHSTITDLMLEFEGKDWTIFIPAPLPEKFNVIFPLKNET